MAESVEPHSPLPPGALPGFVEKASPAVDVSNIAGNLWSALEPLGTIHLRLFDKPLVITSGRDSIHAPSSKHGQGKALDLRVNDKSPEEAACLLFILRIIARRFQLAVFHESNLPGQAHIHLESVE